MIGKLPPKNITIHISVRFMASKSAKVIAKNTLFLYIRTFITMVVAIYTSRVLLQILGVENFGIYNLVGGVVGLFASLRNIFSSSVQRFLNFEKGKGADERVRRIFCISMEIHLVLALLFILIVECIGVWFITHQLVLPEGRVSDALFVFHCSILTTSISICTIPYDSAIIANERFGFFAWTSIIECVLKLIIVYLLLVLSSEPLINYALLLAVVTLCIRMTCIIYCKRFNECKLKWYWDKDTAKELTSFAGWNFFGNTVFALVNEGTNMMLNTFGGVMANAARGLAYQVRSAVGQLSGNLIVASEPFIVQEAASQSNNVLFKYIFQISRGIYFIMLLTIIPFLIYSQSIMELWLITPPQYSVIFVQIVLIHLLLRTFHAPLDTLFKARGKIKIYQLIDSFTLFLSLPLGYLVLKIGFPLYSVFIVICVVEVINLFSILLWAHIFFYFPIKKYVNDVLFISLLASAILSGMGYVFYICMYPANILQLVIYVILFVALEIFILYFLLNSSEKQYMHTILCRFISVNKIRI